MHCTVMGHADEPKGPETMESRAYGVERLAEGARRQPLLDLGLDPRGVPGLPSLEIWSPWPHFLTPFPHGPGQVFR